ncbi:alanine dehydrogenase [Clostridium sp.]|uniref:alanine dehydrogenase n=1 Tax=Clostridium sp. TaxID=1506 RepID=UPI003217499A
MIIGIPKEIKTSEYTVAISPSGVAEFVSNGHVVLIEESAGVGSGFYDEEYVANGAIITDKTTVYNGSDMVFKVKELLPSEFEYLREGLIIMTYFHSNAYRDETDACLNKKIIGIACEDVQDKYGNFPLLRPMSEIGGKGGFIAACNYSQKINQGSGKMLARVNGIKTPHITILGAGSAGIGAAELAAGFGNRVTVLDIDYDILENAKGKLPLNVEFLHSNPSTINEVIKDTDVLMNCVSWPKWRKDHIITRDMLKTMKKDTIIIDVACDIGGAVETCHATTHNEPVYFEEEILHYCVDNIPSAYSRTATCSICSATVPYALEIANKGAKKALVENPHLRKGLCFYLGSLTLEETGLKQDRKYITPEEALGII